MKSDSTKAEKPPAKSKLHETARWYAAQGWHVLPLKPKRKEPLPGGHGHKDGTADPNKIEAWWAKHPERNIGIQTGKPSGLFVVDVDPRNGGEESFEEMVSEFGPLPDTVVVHTGGGGRHYYFKCPVGGLDCRSNVRPGIDIKGDGGYVAAPPSIHPSGGEYVFELSSDPADGVEIADAPAWLLNLIRKDDIQPVENVKERETNPPKSAEPIISWAKEELAKDPKDGDRSARDYAVVCKLIEAGLSKDAIQRIVSAYSKFAERKDDYFETTFAAAEKAATPKKITTDVLAEAILRSEHFAQDAGGFLYVYDGGVYTPYGERRIRKLVKDQYKKWSRPDKWTKRSAGEVAEFIRIDAPNLWERPQAGVINVKNGLLNVETKTLTPHSPDHLSSVRLPITFDPAATCPAIDKFVGETFPKDAPDVAFEMLAYLMTPMTGHQKAVLLLGAGANGKSRYIELVQAFIGRANCSNLSLHKIESDKFAAARLVGKLVNACADLPSAHLAGSSMFKAITGGDAITGERKFRDPFEFVPFARLLFSANTAPRSGDNSDGFFRRWVVIPFDQTFEGKDAIPAQELDARLQAPSELSGALNRALELWDNVANRGLSAPKSLQEAALEFRETTDPFTIWLDTNTQEGAKLICAKTDLANAYNAYADRIVGARMSPHAITKAVKRARPGVLESDRVIHGRHVQVWAGLGLTAKDAQEMGAA